MVSAKSKETAPDMAPKRRNATVGLFENQLWAVIGGMN
jgi:hypothetical protein